MKKKSKEAKFFCESCGSEVPRSSKVCPTCGKFFAAVRCPQCGATGSNDDFKDGCPRCGYAINPDGTKSNGSGLINLSGSKNKKGKKSKQEIDWSIFSGRHNGSSAGYAESGLPVWVYASSVFVLIILMICLYSCL